MHMYRTKLIVLMVCSALGNIKAQTSIDFSSERGFYTNSFQLILSSGDLNAQIRYTIDGITPSPSSGSIYSGPITINETTVVKALAHSSLDTSRVEAHTYVYTQDIINQPSSTSGFPTATGFSTSIKNDGTYGPMLASALTDIPFMSLSLDLTDYNTINGQKGLVKQAHIEFYDGLELESYDRSSGVSTYGNTSFSASNANKKNYRLRFQSQYGASKFKFDVFGKDAAEEFDVLDLRAGSQESFDRGGVQNMHEQILKDTQLKLSGSGVHGRFVHLYINAVYWGVYTLSERPAKSFGESYFSGDKDDYNTMKATCCVDVALPIDGTDASFNTMRNQLSNYPNIEQYLDVDHFIDYVMLCNYGPHGDWRTWNTYAIDNPVAGEPYRFFMWDPEPSFENDWYYTDIIVDTRSHEDIWQPLKGFNDFRVRVGDRMECNCEEAKGPLNPTNFEAYYDEIFQRHKLAYLAEAARWANKTLYDDFLDYRDNIINSNWFFSRKDEMKTAYKGEDLYPSIDAVNFSSDGGIVSSDFQVSLSNPNSGGTIYYTLDGSDPRNAGGSISSNATTYNGAITLPVGVHTIAARVRINGVWSAMCPKRFYVDQNYSDLVINEIHYNPIDEMTAANDTISGKNFEFVEIKNCGDAPVNLLDVQFNKGITLHIQDPIIIQPNQFVVFADDAAGFLYKYGLNADAEYVGKLDNGGENLWLVNPDLEIIDSLDYNDKSPWPSTADKGYYSLALTDCSIDNADPASWSIQSVFTTPRAENYFTNFGQHPYSGIVINEIHYNPKDSIVPDTTDTISGRKFEFVELKNISTIPIDLSGSFFARGIDYEFADGVIIQPGDFIVLAEDKSSFLDRYNFQPFDKYDGQLDNGGETLWLVNQSGVILDAVTYDDVFPWDFNADGGTVDYSLALVDGEVNNDTYLNWSVQCNLLYTPKAENDLACFTGPNYSGLIINEFEYSPSSNANLEFIEIVNKGFFPIDLEGLRISSAVSYDFKGGDLFPGQYFLLARDSALFKNTYNVTVNGDYNGGLSSNGETILLNDLFGNTIDEVSYGVSGQWTSEPLQGVKSLALLDVNLDNNLGENWCVQQSNRTPGAANNFADSDNDGIADCNDNCPSLDDSLIGTTCSDGNPCTTGEKWDTNCNCSGGTFADSDNDGVCDAQDQCSGIDDALIGTACEDGDPCTEGETFDTNCQCLGGIYTDGDIDGICDGLDECPAFDDNLIGQPCDDGLACTVGETYTANCECEGGVLQDADNDGVCDSEDQCPGTDDSIIGTSCNDNDPCTNNDQYNTSCNCVGQASPDSDNDGVCDAQDQCPNFDDDLIGQPCDDGIICFVGSTWDSNCQCSGGQYADTDNDGVCDPLDECPGSDDSVDDNNNGIPDGCEGCSDYVTEGSNSTISQDRSANIAITTNGRVLIGDVDYHGGQEVNLTSGFEVKAGAVFHAFIASCN